VSGMDPRVKPEDDEGGAGLGQSQAPEIAQKLEIAQAFVISQRPKVGANAPHFIILGLDPRSMPERRSSTLDGLDSVPFRQSIAPNPVPTSGFDAGAPYGPFCRHVQTLSNLLKREDSRVFE
jgi:hypothetical protein